MRMKMVMASLLVGLSLAGPVAPAGAAASDEQAPRARAACPFCAVVVATTVRTAVMRAAPVVVRGASKLRRGGARSRARVKSAARSGLRWARKTRRLGGRKLVAAYLALPKTAQGCGRGLADYLRDVRLLSAFIACGRGIVELYLGIKKATDPIHK